MSTKSKILTPPKQTKVAPKESVASQATPPLEGETANQGRIAQAVPAAQVETPKADTNVAKAPVAQPTEAEIKRRKIDLYRKQIDELSGLSDEEKKKQEKRRAVQSILAAVGDGVSAIVDLHGAKRGAPYVKRSSTVDYLRNQWDKEDAEARAQAKEDYTLYQQMEAANRAEEELKYRRKREAEKDEYDRKKDAEDKTHREREAEQRKRQFDVNMAQRKKEHEDRMKQDNAQFYTNQERLKNQYDSPRKKGNPVYLGEDEFVNIPSGGESISAIFAALPDEVKEAAMADFAFRDEYDYQTEKQTYKPMTKQQMVNAIGKYLSHPDAKAARELARKFASGETSATRSEDSTMPGVQDGNTMPGVK